MLATYMCLLALVSSSFSLSETLPWNKKVMTKFFTSRRHLYGSSAGFKPANVKDYPFMVSLGYDAQSFPQGAGAILNKHWILTTAYSTILSPDEMGAYVGTNNAGRSGQRLSFKTSILHEKFNPDITDLEYNIALIKTVEPIKFSDNVKPVKLGKSVPKDGTDCDLLGYGYLQDKPYVGWDLGKATVEVKPKSECDQQYGALKTAYCAEADNVVPCFGDIGDLLMYKGKLVGMYIVGDYCNQLQTAEVYNNVPSFKKWIWQTIKHNSNPDEMEGLFEHEFLDD